MAVLALWIRADLKARRRGWLVLALLLGLAGGTVVAAVAGARRTDSAYGRFLAAQHAADVTILDDGTVGGRVDVDALARRPEVAAIARGSLIFYTINDNASVAAADDALGRRVNRFRIISGRMYHSERADEVVVGFGVARRAHIHVGSTFDLIPSEFVREAEAAGIHQITLHTVGIVAAPAEFPPQYVGLYPSIHMTPAFFRIYGSTLASGDVDPHRGMVFIRLKHGVDLRRFQRSIQREYGECSACVQSATELGVLTQRSFHFQAVGLWLLAAFGGMAILLAVGQALSRHIFDGAGEFPTLRALGVGRRILTVIGLAEAALTGAVGAAIAIGVAYSLSPLTPVGDARIAEPHPGFAFDTNAAVVGAAAILAITIVVAAVPAWRAARSAARAGTERSSQRTSAPSRFLARLGLPASTVTGTRLALEPGRRRSAASVRSSLLGMTIGVAVLAGALVFGTSLEHLLHTPALYGVRWDGTLSNFGDGPDLRDRITQLESVQGVTDLAIGSNAVAEIGGITVPYLALDRVRGDALPPIVEGREPRRADEIALGRRTLHRIDARLGDRVAVRLPFGRFTGGKAPSAMFTIVGRTVIAGSGTSATPPGEGVLTTVDGMIRLAADHPDPLLTKVTDAYVRFARGNDHVPILKRLAVIIGRRDNITAAAEVKPDTPSDIVSFGRTQDLPLFLGGILALIAAATLAHVVASTVRSRRRDLAILKTIGFVRGQIRATVAWTATVLIVLGLAVGIPAGIALGRWAWTVFADELGMVPRPAVRLVDIVLLVPAGLALANFIAAIPGHSASRLRPAMILRTE